MSSTMHTTPGAQKAIVGEPEVVEDARDVEASPAWLSLKTEAVALQALQAQDGSVPEASDRVAAAHHVAAIIAAIDRLRPRFPHDDAYLAASVRDFQRWAEGDSACPISSTRSSPSHLRSTGSTASGIWWCSRCTRRTGRATGSSRR